MFTATLILAAALSAGDLVVTTVIPADIFDGKNADPPAVSAQADALEAAAAKKQAEALRGAAVVSRTIKAGPRKTRTTEEFFELETVTDGMGHSETCANGACSAPMEMRMVGKGKMKEVKVRKRSRGAGACSGGGCG